MVTFSDDGTSISNYYLYRNNNSGMKAPNNNLKYLEFFEYSIKTEEYDNDLKKYQVFNKLLTSFQTILKNIDEEYLNDNTNSSRKNIIDKELSGTFSINSLGREGTNKIDSYVEKAISNNPSNCKNLFLLIGNYSIFKIQKYPTVLFSDNREVRELKEVFNFLDQFELNGFLISHLTNDSGTYENLSYEDIKAKYYSDDAEYSLTEDETKLLIKNLSTTQFLEALVFQMYTSFKKYLTELSSLKKETADIYLEGIGESIYFRTTYSKGGIITSENFNVLDKITSVKWDKMIDDYRTLAKEVITNGNNSKEEELKNLRKTILCENQDINTELVFSRATVSIKNPLYNSLYNKYSVNQILVEFCLLNIANLSEMNEIPYNNGDGELTGKVINFFSSNGKTVEILEAYNGKKSTLSYSELFKSCKAKASAYLDLIDKELKTGAKEAIDEEIKASSFKTFKEYTNSRLKFLVTEKDFFYINNKNKNLKEIPDNFYTEIQFKVYKEEIVNSNISSLKEEWVYVTNKEIEKNIFAEDSVYSDNYFSSFNIEDNNGVRTISLELSSIDDFNLENIILRSLRLQGIYSDIKINSINTDDITSKSLVNFNSDFRVRFGYKTNSNDVFKPTSFEDEKFINRTKEKNPVVTSPWIGFKITGMDTNLINNKSRFTITGVESSGYLANMLSLIIPSQSEYSKNFSDTTGTPQSVIGKFAEYLSLASNKKILILGSEDNTIITGVNDSGNSFTMENFSISNNSSLKSDLDFDVFYNTLNDSKATSKDFSFYDSDEEDIPTITEILDKMVNDYLPSRYYKIYRDGSDDRIKASVVKVDEYREEKTVNGEFKGLKVEKPKYNIFRKKINLDGEFKEVMLIQFYYSGPYTTIDIGNENNLRVYSFKNYDKGLITDISLSSGMNFGIAASAVTMLGKGVEMTFTPTGMNYDDGGKNSKGTAKKVVEPSFCLKGNYKHVDTGLRDYVSISEASTNDEKQLMSTQADLLFDSLSSYPYKGTVTMLGDPFYLFDTAVRPFEYEIYLNIHKNKNIKMEELKNSFYSGIYNITKITHSLSEDGFTTELEVIKKTIG